MSEDLLASPLVLRFSAVMGVPPEELLLACGLSLGTSGLAHADGMRLWSKLEELTGDEYVGLSAGARVSLDFMGMMGLAFASAADLAAGLRLLERTVPLLIRNAPFTLAFERERGGVIYEAPISDVRHGMDSMLGAILHLSRSCTGHRLVPLEVALQSAAPANVSPYREFFGVVPAFGADACMLWFASDDLERPFRGADPATASVLVAHAPELLALPAQPPFLERVEAAILRSLDSGDGSLSDVATRLETSVRTLQRRLSASGQTYPAMRRRAVEQLVDGWLASEMSIKEIAKRAGYGSRSSFERAFVQWRGETPAAVRARLRESTG